MIIKNRWGVRSYGIINRYKINLVASGLKIAQYPTVFYNVLCAVRIMGKILCEFEGKKVQCKVLENMGFQGGDYVKAVEYEGNERIVVKRGKIWRPKTVAEKFGGFRGGVCGQ